MIKHEDPIALQQEHAELKAKLERLEKQLKSLQSKPATPKAVTPPIAPAPPPMPALSVSYAHSPPGVRAPSLSCCVRAQID